MNKLNVALNLLKLLNERREIDSALVAGELNVSIRTAQRYLCDLSSLPCVSHDEQNHKFCIVPDYPLKKALLDCTLPATPLPPGGSAAGATQQVRYGVCKSCGGDCDPAKEYRVISGK
jgi:hypothetical protein